MTAFLEKTKSTKKSFNLLLSCIFLLLTSTVSQKPIVGGYSPVKDLNDTRIVEAAEFAFASFVNLTSSELTLPSITPEQPYSFSADLESFPQVVAASTQVVAGLNIDLVIMVLGKGSSNSDDESCLGSYSVTVYDHFGNLSITSWGEEYSCEEARSMLTSEAVFESEQPEPSSSVDSDESNPSLSVDSDESNPSSSVDSDESNPFSSVDSDESNPSSSVDSDDSNPSNLKSSAGGMKFNVLVVFIVVAISGKEMV